MLATIRSLIHRNRSFAAIINLYRQAQVHALVFGLMRVSVLPWQLSTHTRSPPMPIP